MELLIKHLVALYERDLSKLKQEIQSYESEEKLWQVSGSINNSAGNLCLHLTGNLRHFIGAILGKTGFVRNREAEFSSENIPQSQLIKDIESTIVVVKEVLPQLTEEQLAQEYPIQVFGYPMPTSYFLIHLAMHLDYHLGQINYHRRLL
ncbi:DinB family protein [Thermoflexibacter ruber]|uniref:Uncharacterized damage-inducible protein DinB (Forms a four-helix bundle) n=1 Tax=Thermoflexibacter ruber TaxID=1003 RepID=A0A1I2E7L0_9BACT|nr:DinB family protein [Thermoflexibacter ruber]SFE88922.1 Uncharacterized damage-inducible protein DinB (forms a four-helix bundle) [Thermoflexibacter ruber]